MIQGDSKFSKTNKIAFGIVLLMVVLCSCLFVGTVVAWLKRDYSYSSDANKIGSVDVKIVYNNVEIQQNQPFALKDKDVTKLKIRNVGTIDALVRVTMEMYYKDANNNKCVLITTSTTPTKDGFAKITSPNWVGKFPAPVASGYMFYNDKCKPYFLKEINSDSGIAGKPTAVKDNEISLFTRVEVATSFVSTELYISLTVDAVAYDGNIYKKIENNQVTSSDIPVNAFPFGTKEKLPAEWTAWK